MSYVLPGMSAAEAAHAVGGDAGGWVYGHPYKVVEGVPLPCPAPPADEATGTKRKTAAGLNLGCVIPSFDDDPKSRFMDEIAYTTDGELRSPKPKRAKTEGGGDAVRTALGELGAVSADEFWERMSFRQECVAGAVTGFFTVVVSGGGPAPGAGAAPEPGPVPGLVGGQVAKRLVTMLLDGVEFSTRARAGAGDVDGGGRGAGAVRGRICDGICGDAECGGGGRPGGGGGSCGAGARCAPEEEDVDIKGNVFRLFLIKLPP